MVDSGPIPPMIASVFIAYLRPEADGFCAKVRPAAMPLWASRPAGSIWRDFSAKAMRSASSPPSRPQSGIGFIHRFVRWFPAHRFHRLPADERRLRHAVVHPGRHLVGHAGEQRAHGGIADEAVHHELAVATILCRP